MSDRKSTTHVDEASGSTLSDDDTPEDSVPAAEDSTASDEDGIALDEAALGDEDLLLVAETSEGHQELSRRSRHRAR